MRHLLFVISISLLAACSGETNHTTSERNPTPTSDSTVIFSEESDSSEEAGETPYPPDAINRTDSNGLKQGTWIDSGRNGRVVSIRNYLNDTLHGYWFDWRHGQEDGNFHHGKKHGYFRHYYGEKSDDLVMMLFYFESDSALWSAFPMADQHYLIPIKGIHVKSDSVMVQAPFTNGKMWYEGLFINHKPKGIHRVYNEEGKLRAKVEYNLPNVTIILPDSSEYDITKTGRRGGYRYEVIVEK